MLTRWTSHLKTEEEKQLFKNRVLADRDVLQRLYDIVEEDERDAAMAEVNPKAYSNPSWAYFQADKIGQKRYMKQMKALLTLDRKETNNEPLGGDRNPRG